MHLSIPGTSFVLPSADGIAERIGEIPQSLTQKADEMMASVPSADWSNLDPRDLAVRRAMAAKGTPITGEFPQPGTVAGARHDSLTKYNIIEYPENVGSERYPHYMAFFINEYILNGEDASSGRKGRADNYLDDEVRTIDKSGVIQTGNTTSSSVAGGSSRAASSGASNIGEKTGTSGKINIGAKVKRTKDAIILYTPNQVRQQYGAGYEEFTNASVLGSTLMAAANSNSIPDALSIAGDGASNIASEAAAGAIGGIGKLAGMEGAFSAVSKVRGKITNPRTEILFQTIRLREHQFTYTFSPRNANECDKIEQIIKMFKVHMHPMVQTQNDSTGNYLIMPSEFDIEFFYKTEANTHVPKILTCVLESCVVDYTPNDKWSTFDGIPYPTHIIMTLTFKELEPLNAAHIMEGF